MKLTSICSICNVFERMHLSWIGPMMLTVGGFLAVLSLFVWPLLIVWPAMLATGFMMTAGYGACSECQI